MTAEDRAYLRLTAFLGRQPGIAILSSHPPSGKAYDTDLIRIPNPSPTSKGSRRWHIDVLFCSASVLYACELKGRSAESTDDIVKLRLLRSYYTVESLKGLIRARLTHSPRLLASVTELALIVGCESVDSPPPADITFMELADNAPRLYGKAASALALDLRLAAAPE